MGATNRFVRDEERLSGEAQTAIDKDIDKILSVSVHLKLMLLSLSVNSFSVCFVRQLLLDFFNHSCRNLKKELKISF